MLTLVFFNSLIKIFFPLSFLYSFTMNVNSAFEPIYLMTQYCSCDPTRRRKSHASDFIINNTLTISLRLIAATRFGQYLAFYKGGLIKISSQVTYDYVANPQTVFLMPIFMQHAVYNGIHQRNPPSPASTLD